MTDPIAIAAGSLLIVLSRIGDRYRHEILLATEETRPVLASVEGGDDQAWPPSPPFQELHLPQQGAALLVGRAGRSHWSASIEPDPLQEAISFDIACRSAGIVDWLGSSYTSVTREVVGSTDERRMLLLPPHLEVDILEGEARVGDEGPTRVFSIRPTWNLSGASQTVRWRYRIRRQPSRP